MAHHTVACYEFNDVHVDLFERLHKGVPQHAQGQDADDGGLSQEVSALQLKE